MLEMIQENNFLFNIDDNEIEVWVNDIKGDIRYLISITR